MIVFFLLPFTIVPHVQAFNSRRNEIDSATLMVRLQSSLYKRDRYFLSCTGTSKIIHHRLFKFMPITAMK